MDADDEDHGSGGALGELIEVERRIEAEIAAAEAQARSLVEAARADVARGDREGDTALGQALAALRESVGAQRDAAIRDIEARAAGEVQRYRGFDEAAIDRLASWLAERVAGDGAGS